MPTRSIMHFYFLPRKEEAILFSYKLENGKISYFQMDVNTSKDMINLGTYEPLEDSEALITRINQVTNPKLN